MNWDAWKPLAVLIFTSSLKFAGGLLVAHGLATQGPGLEALGGAATTAAGAFWSWWVQKGHIQAGDYLKKLTDTATQAAAIEVARRMPLASVTGAAAPAKAEAKAIEPAVMAKDAAKTAIILVLLAAGALLFPGDAKAQQPRFVKPTGNIVNDIAAATGSKTTLTGAPVTDIQNFLNAKFLPDLQYALKLASASKNSVTADCYQAWIDIITTQQTAVKNADGTDQAMPDPHVITEFEKLVELRNALQPESQFMIKCSPVASMIKMDIAQFMGIVISGGAGLATLVPGL